MQEIDKEKFIKDIRKDLGIPERNYEQDYKLEGFGDDQDFGELVKIFYDSFSQNSNKVAQSNKDKKLKKIRFKNL